MDTFKKEEMEYKNNPKEYEVFFIIFRKKYYLLNNLYFQLQNLMYNN